MAGLTVTGFEAKTFEEIEAEIKAALWAGVSNTLNLSSTSALGQYVSTVAAQITQGWEAGQAIYASRDIDQAEGDALTALCALTGTNRRGVTYSTVLVNVTFGAGPTYPHTFPAGTLTIFVDGSAAAVFENQEDVLVNAAGTVNDIVFVAQDGGAVRAEAGTLDNIANPVSGFLSATNPLAAVLGEDIETDAALRFRQRQENARRGSHTIDAIRADLSDALPTSSVTVFENDTDVAFDGIPPHSIECLIQVGSETAATIREAIFLAKPAGIRAYGAITGPYVDSQNNTHTIGYTTPTLLTIWIRLALTVIPDIYLGDTAVKMAIVNYYDTHNRVGLNVLKARIETICLGVGGVVDASAEIGITDGGEVAANLVVGHREIATFLDSRIAITQTFVAEAP